VRGNRFQIGRDARAARRIKTRDHQNDWRRRINMIAQEFSTLFFGVPLDLLPSMLERQK
jgi:hypothetical protein